MNSYKKNHHIKSGVDTRFKKGQIPHNKGKKVSSEMYEKMKSTMFKPGNIPPNKKNIGDIVLRADGYLCKKVLDKGMQKERFKLLHREIWEKHNGPVPDGMVIGFLDGNTENCDISNLFSISRELNLEMNRKRLRFERPEMTETGVNIAKLDIALRKKRGRRKK